jgi:hypothetical protein
MGDLTEHFSAWEFACRCGCGFGTHPGDIPEVLLTHLETQRRIVNRVMSIRSGARCPAYNASPAVGGVDDSAHTRSAAVDLAVSGGVDRIQLILTHVLARFVERGLLTLEEARNIHRTELAHMGGLGVANSFLHEDLDIVKPRPAAWTY